MTQVVRPLHQFKGKLIEGECGLTCSAPRHAVRRGIDVVPSRVTKHASIRRHVEAFHVFAEHADEDRRNRDRSCVLGRTSLQGVDLMDGTVADCDRSQSRMETTVTVPWKT
ncbi:hypothetical protein ACWGJW_33380 [Streptomyces nigrescens]